MEVREQQDILNQHEPAFGATIASDVEAGLTALSLKTFQINVGRWCNQACRHCHVDASPTRTEMMDRETAELCIDVLSQLPDVDIVDITGGAPEGNEHFRYLVEASKGLGKHVMDRCNLTILEEPGFEDLHTFLASHEVEIVASLPHFAAARTDNQRGRGVFEKSIAALQKLNAVGYGSDLALNLVYNPSGVFLSSSQAQLEREFREQLQGRYDIVFNHLYCLNNIPINRYLEALVRADKFEAYMERLVEAYNPDTLTGLMCRHMVSVGYDGQIYDCDFNQMLEMPAKPVSHLRDFDLEVFLSRQIRTSSHCFGCTAGAGSSCGGEVVVENELVNIEAA